MAETPFNITIWEQVLEEYPNATLEEDPVTGEFVISTNSNKNWSKVSDHFPNNNMYIDRGKYKIETGHFR